MENCKLWGYCCFGIMICHSYSLYEVPHPVQMTGRLPAKGGKAIPVISPGSIDRDILRESWCIGITRQAMRLRTSRVRYLPRSTPPPPHHHHVALSRLPTALPRAQTGTQHLPRPHSFTDTSPGLHLDLALALPQPLDRAPSLPDHAREIHHPLPVH